MANYLLLEDYAVDLTASASMGQSINHNPISRYNYVIENYNKEMNLIENKTLKLMPESKIYRLGYFLLSNFWGEFLLIFCLVFLPIINIFFYFIIWFSLIFYQKCYAIYIENEKNVNDPFQKMVFSPEICQRIKKINWIFQIQFENLTGLALNLDTIEFLKQRKDNDRVSFMIYDNIFWSFYNDFIKFRLIHAGWIVGASILLILSIFIGYLYSHLLFGTEFFNN